MVEVYFFDRYQQFTEKDKLAIVDMVDSVEITSDGKWLMFVVPFTGTCENSVIRKLEKLHPSMSRKYAEGYDAFLKEARDNVVLELGDEKAMGEWSGEEE